MTYIIKNIMYVVKLSQDCGVVDQYIYSVTIAIGLTHSIRMKVKQFH